MDAQTILLRNKSIQRQNDDVGHEWWEVSFVVATREEAQQIFNLVDLPTAYQGPLTSDDVGKQIE